MHMENNIKVVNKVGKDIDVKVDSTDGFIAITVEYPQDRIRLSRLNSGDIFKVNDVQYIVLEQFWNGTTAVIRKDILSESMVFGLDDNDWKNSEIRKFLNSEYLGGLKESFGQDSIVNHVTELKSLDGLSDYGRCTDKVGLLSIEQYWRYRESIGDKLYESENAWWLVTPDSTPSGFGSNGVLHVGSMGDIGCSVCNFCMGIRPYFVLRDSVMVAFDGHVGIDG